MNPDTQTVLLLAARLPGGGAKPLTPTEYDKLARWLHAAGTRPSSLLEEGALADLHARRPCPLDLDRLAGLLSRGAAVALAVEDWERRGLWVLSRGDAAYPSRWRTELGRTAPPLLYGTGATGLMAEAMVAIVGSRDVDEAGLACARSAAQAAVASGRGIVSGGARGVDGAAQQAALEAGGAVVCVLPDRLQSEAVKAAHRGPLSDHRLALISPFSPAAGFNAGAAMARNALIYALADAAIVPATANGSGGTWAGATAALKKGRPPVFVRVDADAPEGNHALAGLGARELTDDWLDRLEEAPAQDAPDPVAPTTGDQLPLFD